MAFTTQKQLKEQTFELLALLSNGVTPASYPPISLGLLRECLIEGLYHHTWDDDSFDTNGWQWDYWHNFSINGHLYTASGSGYYGEFTINHNTEVDDD